MIRHCALGALLLASAVAPGCRRRVVVVEHRPDDACFTIASWNDLHGQLSGDDPIIDTGRVAAGGVIALGDAVATLRASGEPVFVLDAGDLFTGPMESTLAEGAPVIAAYRVLGVDAATIGNHEFDFGPVGYDRVTAKPGSKDDADGPRGALLERMSQASFPFVSANVRLADGTLPSWKNFLPYVVIERAGFKLGVVGYTTNDTPRTTLKPNVEGLDFVTDAAKHVADGVRALRAQGVDAVVLLAHASLEGDLPQSLGDAKDPNGDRCVGEIARLFAGMGDALPDLVVAGHRHAWMLGRVRSVPIVSTSQHGVGYATTRFCRSGKTTRLKSIERHVAFFSDPPRTDLGERVKQTVAPAMHAVKVEGEAVVGTVPRACYAQAQGGTALVEEVARALLDTATAKADKGDALPTVAVMNSGGVRAPLHAGTVRYADLFTALPFENAVASCVTTRAGLVRALTNMMSKISAADRFPFGIVGAKVHAKRADVGLALVSFDLDAEKGKRLADDAPVRVVLPDFLLFGGDGFLDGVDCKTPWTSEVRLRDAFKASLVTEKRSCDGPAKDIEVEAR